MCLSSPASRHSRLLLRPGKGCQQKNITTRHWSPATPSSVPTAERSFLCTFTFNSICSEKMTEKFLYTEGHRLIALRGQSVGFEIWPIWVQIPFLRSELRKVTCFLNVTRVNRSSKEADFRAHEKNGQHDSRFVCVGCREDGF